MKKYYKYFALIIIVVLIAYVALNVIVPRIKSKEKPVNIQNTTVVRTADTIDFSEYFGQQETEEVEETEPVDLDLTQADFCVWTQEKFDEMQDCLANNYYMGYTQTNTTGLSNLEDVYTTYLQYIANIDVKNKVYKLKTICSSNSKIDKQAYYYSKNTLMQYNYETEHYKKIKSSELDNKMFIDYANVAELFNFLCKDTLPQVDSVGEFTEDTGFEYYVQKDDEVNSALLDENWTEYTKLTGQKIEFVYNQYTKQPVSVTVTIYYVKDKNACYSKTVLQFDSIAYYSSIPL